MVIRSLALAALLLSTSGCVVPLAIGAGAVAGVAATKDGGISGELSDTEISARINDIWFKNDTEMFSKLHTTVDEGRVLITGTVQRPEDRVEAVRLAWQVPDIKQIINEIQVADSEGVGGYLKDKWIGTQLRAKLTATRDVHAIDYSIDVVRGVVYLMGVSRSQAELNEVVDIARNIAYVQNVVSYVRVAVPEAPVIRDSANGGGVQPLQNNNNVTSYPVTQSTMPSGPASSSSRGMQPIVDDPGAGNTSYGGGVIGAPSGGVTRENLP